MGLRRSFEYALLGVPHGPLGHVGAWLMASMKGKFYGCMASELDLQAGDELLDVGCGSARFFAEHAGHVRYVAGIDASEIQVELARRRLTERIAAGTAEVVLGDAAELPWEDGRFSAVTSLDALKFAPDPPEALSEMYRVLQPGGRAVFTMGDDSTKVDPALRDTWGIWSWSDADAQRLVEEAGFVDVAVSVLPVISKAQLVRASKQVSSTMTESAVGTAAAGEALP